MIKLRSLRLRNFRGYIDETIFFESKMNVIIGKNDVGKSTILEALEIFFNNDQIKIDPKDLNIDKRNEGRVYLNCTFKLDCDEIIIDSSCPTNTTQEYLLNKDGFLEIQKEWNCEKEKIGINDQNTYIVSWYPQISSTPLVCEKISELKKILEECVDKETYRQIDKTKSSTIRKGIYDTLITEKTEFMMTLIDTSKVDAKDIWNSLKINLPLYFLFKSDRINNDKDAEVQSPMKAATKIVLGDMKDKLDEVCDTVKKEVEKIGRHTIEKLKELDPDIAKLLTPNVTMKPFDSVFSFDLLSDDGIPLNKRGSGIRRLILLSYFRAEAEKKIKDNPSNSVIYAIEEPETSQHPDYQRMILETLQQLSRDGYHQIILTTHTPEIAKMVDLSQLIFIDKDINRKVYVEEENERKFAAIVMTLGIHPFAVSQVVICVEGENDVNFIYNINESVPEYKDIISLKEKNIKIVPMTGSNLVRWVNENYFMKSNIKEIHLYDNDRNDYKDIITKISCEKDGRRFGWNTVRRAMENYIPPILIEEFFDICLDKYKESWDTIDVVRCISSKIFTEIESLSEREKIIKNYLNGRLTKRITAEKLREINAFDELRMFFLRVKSIYEETCDDNIYNGII